MHFPAAMVKALVKAVLKMSIEWHPSAGGDTATESGGFRSRHHSIGASAAMMPSSAKRLIGSSTSSGRNNATTAFQRFANDVGELEH